MIPNISNITFKSTFKVSNHTNSPDAFLKFADLCDSFESEDNSSVWYEERISSKDLMWHKMYSLIVDDSKDGEVETYCANHGIKFQRYYKNQLLDTDKVKKRIIPPKGDLKLVEVKPDRLVEIARRQDSSIIKNQSQYRKIRKTKVMNMIKSGLPIPTSYLHIMNNDPNQSNAQALQAIKENGAKNLRNKQLNMNFISLTDQSDDSMFFAFWDMGMTNIPLYVDKGTYKFAKALKILAE